MVYNYHMSLTPSRSKKRVITDRQVSKILLKTNIFTKEEVQELLKIQTSYRKEGKKYSLAKVIIKKNLMGESELRDILQVHSRFKEIGGYRIIKRLGIGGMGSVYQATQISMNREIALKVLSRSCSKNKSFIKRFIREARASAKLNHPNIVRAFDVGKDRGRYYFAMDLIQGQTLNDVIEQVDGPLEENYSLNIVKQVTLGLAHATTQDIIHRDIKPDNILLTAEGVAKIVDLGIVKIDDGSNSFLTTAGFAMGTPHYISPEQAKGEEDVDFRTDFYSLGATLYHMVTHRVPFEGDHLAKILSAHISVPLTDPQELNPNLSKGCSLLIQRMMKKDKKERYPSHEELLKDLDLVLNKQNIKYPIYPGKFRSLFLRFPQRNKWQLIAIAFFVFTTLIVIIWATIPR